MVNPSLDVNTIPAMGSAVADAQKPEDDFPYNFQIFQPLVSSKKINLNIELSKFLENYLQGMSNVDLVDISVTYKAPKADLFIIAAITNNIGTKTIAQVKGMKTSLNFTSNAMDCGVQTTVSLVMPSNVARQILPVSSVAPMPKILLSAHKDMDVSLCIELRHYGPYIVYASELDTDSF